MSKITKEGCLSISIYQLKKWGYLSGYRGGRIIWTRNYDGGESSVGCTVNTSSDLGTWMLLDYSVTAFDGVNQHVEQKYPLTYTHCNYGGKRYWFECSVYKNGCYCGRRVAKLYLGNSKYFACRHCYDLTYRARLERCAYGMDAADLYAEKVKRWYYRGKPTKKHRRLMKISHAIEREDERFYLRCASLLKKRNVI